MISITSAQRRQAQLRATKASSAAVKIALVVAAAIDHVVAAATGDGIVPVAGVDRVVPGASVDHVGGVKAGDGIVARGDRLQQQQQFVARPGGSIGEDDLVDALVVVIVEATPSGDLQGADFLPLKGRTSLVPERSRSCHAIAQLGAST
ncbi:hypothetical protein RP965_19325 (plasmid) [Sinorhizobium meliloti]